MSNETMINGVQLDEIAEMLDSYCHAISDCNPTLDVRCERYHYIPRIAEVSDALRMPSSEQRNRELTRQVEQLQAECDWMRRNAPLAYSQYKALTAPPSSSDHGRNDSKGIEGDTGREEK